MITFCSARKLSNYLVRAKMYPIERTVGCKNCGSKRCEVCMNFNETLTFTNTVTNLTVTRSLSYLLTCCKYKIHYVGQTVDQFCLRWNNCKSDSRKYSRGGSCMQQLLFDHFCTSGHLYNIFDASRFATIYTILKT